MNSDVKDSQFGTFLRLRSRSDLLWLLICSTSLYIVGNLKDEPYTLLGKSTKDE